MMNPKPWVAAAAAPSALNAIQRLERTAAVTLWGYTLGYWCALAGAGKMLPLPKSRPYQQGERHE
jgi:hypothetical protein